MSEPIVSPLGASPVAPVAERTRAVGGRTPHLRSVARVVEREALIYRRLWKASVFSSFVGPVLYLAALGIGLGGLVDASSGTVDGVPYLQFVAPGILAATAMQFAVADSLWPVMTGMRWMRFYHAMVATPIRAVDVYGGTLAWLGIRVALSATSFVIVAAALHAVGSPAAVLAIPAAMLTGVSFAALVMAFAGGEETDARFALVMRIFVLPLFLFSGTFFPITQLPPFLQVLAWISPLWHGVELCRAAMTGVVESPALVLGHIAYLLVIVAIGWVWGSKTFRTQLSS
jgi:lipooligosaccharide transport system permease protein